uniref:Uncharacterized protein n=1 Tax=Oryza brachyantha TaxID=4533 RepID=J3LRP1_ORYBR
MSVCRRVPHASAFISLLCLLAPLCRALSHTDTSPYDTAPLYYPTQIDVDGGERCGVQRCERGRDGVEFLQVSAIIGAVNSKPRADVLVLAEVIEEGALGPVTDVGEFSNTVPLIEVSSSSGSGSGSAAFPGLSSRMTTPGGSSHVARFAMGVAGSAYPTHPVDMVPVRTLQDIHDRQPSVIPRNFAMHSPSSGSQHDGFSYWNMGRFRRNTTAPSFPPSGVAPGNFGKKRNADSNNFLPLKFRKMSGAI